MIAIFSEPKLLPKSVFQRLSLAMVSQEAKTIVCPETSPFVSQTALVTGATNGIGKEIARGLLTRGIRTILLGRSEDKLTEVEKEFISNGIKKELILRFKADLSDLDSLKNREKEINTILGGNKISILVENAGVWPVKYEETKQNFEIAFGTNVLGHQVLRNLLTKNFLSKNPRIVITTGDIYILKKKATKDLTYSGYYGGMKAYCQSKLGNIWIAKELQNQNPNYTVCIVHPGVVSSGLVESGKIGKYFKSKIMLDPKRGAQTSLYVATQPDVKKGGYYHNCLGLCEFPEGDPANNISEAKDFWNLTEEIAQKYIR